MTLEPWWRELQRTWVTFRKADAISHLQGEEVVWAYHPTTRNLINLFRNLFLALRCVRRLRPDLVISTGAGVALPFFVVCRAFGIPTCFIEVYDRLDKKTLTGRLCRPLSNVFMVQWEEQLNLYPDAHLIGPLL